MHKSFTWGNQYPIQSSSRSSCHCTKPRCWAGTGLSAHAILNLDADIHFSLTVSAYNNRGDLTTGNLPQHKIPHYCFGSVAGSIKSLLLFIFIVTVKMSACSRPHGHLSADWLLRCTTICVRYKA